MNGCAQCAGPVYSNDMSKPRLIQKLLAANRSEIAIRIFRAANELGLRTVAVYSKEDRLALHGSKPMKRIRSAKARSS